MKKLEIQEKYRAYSEDEAKDFIETNRMAATGNYILKKAGYEYKTKKAKGEVVDEGYLVTIVKTFESFWD